ncbi:unnamed protein product [Rhizophagus irregularis]|nr:unnamed protein product [Rhizophagus irregularis]
MHDINPRFSENSELSHNIKTLNNVKRFSENSKLSHERSEEKIANTPPNICLEIDRNIETKRSRKENSSDSLPGHILVAKGNNVQASSSIVTEFVQDLLKKLLLSDDPFQTIKFSSLNSFCQANVARNKMILVKRSEITLWCLFSERFKDKVVELRSNDKKLTDLTARKQIYNKMKPDTSDVADYFKEEEEMNESTEVSAPTMPIPEENLLTLSISADEEDYLKMLTRSLDDETANRDTLYENSARLEKEDVNEIRESPRVQSDDDVYFGEVDHNSAPVSSANQETNDDNVCSHDSDSNSDDSNSNANNSDSNVYFKSDDSDSDNGYGGYNEYGEHDRVQKYDSNGYGIARTCTSRFIVDKIHGVLEYD